MDYFGFSSPVGRAGRPRTARTLGAAGDALQVAGQRGGMWRRQPRSTGESRRQNLGYGSAMAIIDPPTLSPCVDLEDPDDYRPNSSWAAVVDPLSSDGVYVSDACVMIDEVAPGDIVPLHTHTTHEVIYVDHSSVEVQLGADVRMAEPGAILFVPPGVPHRARALTEAVRLIGFFPTTVVEITYLERNPAPGTEGDPPQPSVTFDVRSSLKG